MTDTLSEHPQAVPATPRGIAAKRSYNAILQNTCRAICVLAPGVVILWAAATQLPMENQDRALLIIVALLATAGLVALLMNMDGPANAMTSLFCPSCGKYLPVTDPWKCGTCDELNRQFSFMRSCTKCNVEPKAYACYHCGHVIPLSDKHEILHVATRLPESGIAVAAVRAEWVTEKDAREREKSRLADEIEIAKLRTKLSSLIEPNQSDPRSSRIQEILKVPLEGREVRDALRAFRKNEREKIKTLGLSADEERDEMDALDRDIDSAMGNSYFLK
jgi:hypothetical protein